MVTASRPRRSATRKAVNNAAYLAPSTNDKKGSRKSRHFAKDAEVSDASEPDAGDSDAYQDMDEAQEDSDEAVNDEDEVVDSNALDDEPSRSKDLKRKRSSTATASAKTASPKKTPVKKQGKAKPVDDEDDHASMDSDALDDSDGGVAKKKRKKLASPKKRSPRKKDEDEDSGLELKEGQKIVGTVVQAPTTGRVPPGRISKNTFDFLKQLQQPECNDRTWFKLHEPVFRLAEKEWKDFIDKFTPLLIAVDPQIPTLPPNDVVHRIYRDVRFSNDKTPYKSAFSGSFSRSGRKGLFAKYHIAIRPGGSLIAAGAWCPDRNELQTIRNHIIRNPSRIKRLISAPEFVELFGEPKPHPKGERQNIFGHEDQLKTAPKGIDKTHRDIDLLKCRSFAVVHKFTDDEVLDPKFIGKLQHVANVLRPFIHGLNDMMTVEPEDGSDAEGEEGT